MSALPRELRYAIRSLRRSPSFTAAAIGTLAIGIAASAAIFSILHAVVLAPLPYRQPDRLAALWEVMEDGRLWRPAPATFRAWREHARSFESLAAFGGATWTLAGENGAEPVSLRGVRVTPDYFTVLGVAPVVGRAFLAEDAVSGAAPVLVLGHDLWATRFGADPSVVGRRLGLGDRTYTVVGVMPPAPYPTSALTIGKIAFAPGEPQFFVPAALEGSGAPGGRSYVLGVLGRLRPGVGIAAAQEEMTALARRLHREDTSSRAVDARIAPLDRETQGAMRPALWLLFGAVVFVLAIGCANVASLSLARAEARGRELAVRAALGAGPRRIAGPVLLESLLVAAAACVLGSLLAAWTLPLLVAVMPSDVPRLSSVRLHGGILAFAVGISSLAGVAAGLVPALRAARAGGSGKLAGLARAAAIGGPSGRRTLRLLVLSETAIAVLLASGAILLTRSFLALSSVDPGFHSLETAIAHVSLPRSRYGDPASVARFHDTLLARVRALPQVEAASLAYNHPLEADWIGGGRPAGDDASGRREPAPAWFRSVSEDYFRSVGVALVAGRDFQPFDDASHPPVAIVNAAFVRENFPDGRAVGRFLESGDAGSWWSNASAMPNRFEIVGVAADVRFLGLDKGTAPAYYLPVRQFPLEDMNLLVRGPAAAALTPALRRILRELDPALPSQSVSTLERIRDSALAPSRLHMRLMLGFGLVAVGLATLGVYGLLTYVVALRRRELSIRIALGARTSHVLADVVGESAGLAAVGSLIGLLGAAGLSPLLSGVLFGVGPMDPLSLGAAAAALLLATGLASGLPARRAARIAPIEALKGE
jgi:predicted permease